ncbi:MAG: VOC family protein [Mycobacteriales bacterium]
MPDPIRHFAINADDVAATADFYSTVFDWRFAPWGPPGFYQIETGGELIGALQQRRELIPGQRTLGFECTIAVGDVAAATAAIVAAGGRILMERSTIAGVGHLIWFADPSGNVVGAMQYDAAAD